MKLTYQEYLEAKEKLKVFELPIQRSDKKFEEKLAEYIELMIRVEMRGLYMDVKKERIGLSKYVAEITAKAIS